LKALVSIVLTFTALILAGCTSVAVRYDYRPDADFSALKFFAWKYDEQPETGDVRVDNALLDYRIRRAVDQVLKDKGFTKNNRETADFVVAYHLIFRRRMECSTATFGFRTGWYDHYGSIYSSTDFRDYEESLIIIDIFDSKKDTLLWRGTGSRPSYQGSDPEQLTRIINDMVARILSGFPPREK